MGAELYCDGYRTDAVRLQGHVCIYKGEPVLVKQVDLLHRVQISYLKDHFVTETVDYREPEFNYNSPPLGYINVEDDTCYVVRAPGCSGLARTNVRFLPNGSAIKKGKFPENNWLLSREARACILGEHPSVEEALKKMAEGYSGVAFHRHYAFTRASKHTIKIEKRGIMDIGIIKENRVFLFGGTSQNFLKKLFENVEGIDVVA